MAINENSKYIIVDDPADTFGKAMLKLAELEPLIANMEVLFGSRLWEEVEKTEGLATLAKLAYFASSSMSSKLYDIYALTNGSARLGTQEEYDEYSQWLFRKKYTQEDLDAVVAAVTKATIENLAKNVEGE